MTSEITRINRDEALRYLGYTHAPDERISAVIDQCEQELLKEARPQFVWRVFNIQRSGREIFLSDCDFQLEGHDIAEHLRALHDENFVIGGKAVKIHRHGFSPL